MSDLGTESDASEDCYEMLSSDEENENDAMELSSAADNDAADKTVASDDTEDAKASPDRACESAPGDATITLSVSALDPELSCPICMNILQDTHTVMECLHRFCYDCISKALRLGKKECPACRVHVTSRRSLRPDYTFDELIRTIHPDRAAYEAEKQAFIDKVTSARDGQNLTDRIRIGIQRQSQVKKKRVAGRRKTGAGDASSEDEGETMVEFLLLPHQPDLFETFLEREFLRTSEQVAMKTLVKYLNIKCGGINKKRYKIGYRGRHNHFTALTDEQTLADVSLTVSQARAAAEQATPLVLLYSTVPTT